MQGQQRWAGARYPWLRARRFAGGVFAGSVFPGSVFGCSLLACSLLACSGRDVSQLDASLAPAHTAEAGQLELALTSHGASGALYRLRQAQFQVFGVGPFGSFEFLSTENDPLATSLETTLNVGDYQISLFPGWFLEKVVAGQVTHVQASLLSPDMQSFSITANGETAVQYRFQTNGEVVEFGQGRLIVQIDVEEAGSEPPPPPPPDLTLGEPLQILDGVISADSNPHGISAALFAAAAPIGASIEVTSDSGEMCVRGSIDPVLNEDFGTQWGTVFGLEFLSDTGEPAPWDLDGGNVLGFAFSVSGPDLPLLRFTALPGGADGALVNFCRPFSAFSGDRFALPLDSLDLSCWLGERDPLITDNLANIAWTVPSDIGIGHTFDVCISDLRPILR
jgi:hypothetical protein